MPQLLRWEELEYSITAMTLSLFETIPRFPFCWFGSPLSPLSPFPLYFASSATSLEAGGFRRIDLYCTFECAAASYNTLGSFQVIHDSFVCSLTFPGEALLPRKTVLFARLFCPQIHARSQTPINAKACESKPFKTLQYPFSSWPPAWTSARLLSCSSGPYTSHAEEDSERRQCHGGDRRGVARGLVQSFRRPP